MITTVDRTKAPAIQQGNIFDLSSFGELKLSNGIPVYTLQSEDVKLIKLELMFKAGRWFESKKLVSGFTAKMINQGTQNHSSAQIAEILDFYGATFSIQSNLEFSVVRLIVLPKYFKEVLDLIAELLTEASFPEEELGKLISRAKQKLRINQQKSEYLATTKFTDVLFGKDHPYGYNPEMEDFDQVNTADLEAHYKKYYTAQNCEIYLTGCYADSTVEILQQTLGSRMFSNGSIPGRIDIPFNPDTKLEHRLYKENAQQAAIRIGMQTINKHDPEYDQLRILNVLFGGYFGSRLMANIREDKGYTYGIYSSLVSLLKGGYQMIMAEVGLEYVEPTLHEIRYEIDRLKNEPVPEAELSMVKNYMIGSLMSRVDGVFKLSNVLKDLRIYNLSNEDHRAYMQRIKDTSAEDIQEYANKYLDIEKMYKVIVA